MSTAFSNAHLWNIPFVMGDVITSLWSKETPRRMYESKRAKKHKSIQQRLNDCGITYWVLNRFTNCIASKFMLCFTSILCCFTGCLGKQTAHYLLRLLTTNTLLTTFTFLHTTHARRSSGRLQLIMYFISHIKLLRFARMQLQLDPVPNMEKKSYENLSELLWVCVLCVCKAPSKVVCVCVVCAQTIWYSSK